MSNNNYKYRGKYKEGGWRYGYYFYKPFEDTHWIKEITIKGNLTTEADWTVDPKTVGQWSGETDIDDVQMFAHDLIQDQSGDIRELIFKEGSFMLEYPNGMRYMPTKENRKVISNIHDNET